MTDIGPAAAAFWERVTGSARSAASRLRVKSALNPMLWLCAIISLPCFGFAWFARGVEPLATVLTGAGLLPVIVTCIMAGYFAVFRPDKLQSEEYQIRHETLELIKKKGSSIEVSPSSLDNIANPLHPLPPLPAD